MVAPTRHQNASSSHRPQLCISSLQINAHVVAVVGFSCASGRSPVPWRSLPRPRWLFSAAHRQREGERRTHTHLALCPDLPTVEFHKLPAQGEPEARALDLLRRCPHLTELLEDLLLILGGNADPGVAY